MDANGYVASHRERETPRRHLGSDVRSELGSPIFFGPSSITVKVSWDTDPGVIGSENVTEIKTDLHNDGKSLGSGNFTVTWHGNIPTVTTHGEEQPDQSYTFNWK